jgi:hypothetical protein
VGHVHLMHLYVRGRRSEKTRLNFCVQCTKKVTGV